MRRLSNLIGGIVIDSCDDRPYGPTQTDYEYDKMVQEQMGNEITEPFIDILFDGPPSHESGRFVEVEDNKRHSISVGEWIKRDDGYWALRIADPRALAAARAERDALRYPAELFDSYFVFQHLSDQARKRTGPENVSDALDALKRAIDVNAHSRRSD